MSPLACESQLMNQDLWVLVVIEFPNQVQVALSSPLKNKVVMQVLNPLNHA